MHLYRKFSIDWGSYASKARSIYDGSVPTPFLQNCTFINNKIVYTAALFNIANDNVSKHVLQSGMIDIESNLSEMMKCYKREISTSHYLK